MLDTEKILTDAGMSQLVTSPTHGKNILDKFITNAPELFNVSVIKSSLTTKHMAILVNCHFQTDDTKVKRKVIQFYDIRKHNLDALGKALSTHRWGAVYASVRIVKNELGGSVTQRVSRGPGGWGGHNGEIRGTGGVQPPPPPQPPHQFEHWSTLTMILGQDTLHF